MIKISLKAAEYIYKYNKYKSNKRFKVISQDNQFSIRERNRYYILKVSTGIFLSVISLGAAPLFSKSVRKLFCRKVSTYIQMNASKSVMSESRGAEAIAKVKLYQPENLIPNKQISLDVINLVTQFLEPKEISNLRRVNKDWYHYISQEKSLDIFTAYVATNLRKAIHRYDLKVELIKALAQKDIKKAKLLLPFVKKGYLGLLDSAWFEIIQVEAKTDVKTAIDTLKSLQFTTDKFLRYLVGIEAQKDIKKAKETANSIQSKDEKEYAFLNLVRILVQTDIEGAKKIVEEIEDSHYKDQALLEIVKIEAQTDIEGAKETAHRMDAHFHKDGAFLEIVKIQAKTDIEGAKETQKLMWLPEKAFKEIIKAEAQKDIEKAKKIAKNRGIFWRDEEDLLKIEAQKDLKKFKKAAKGIGNSLDRERYYFVSVEVEAPNDLVEAKKIAARIRGDIFKSRALVIIVKEEAKKDIMAAFETAKSIPLDSGKISAFIEIFQAMNQSS